MTDENPEDQADPTEAAPRLTHPSPVPLAGGFGSLGEELRTDVPIQSGMLANAIGGWRGIIDSSLPSLVFVIAYLVTSQNLTIAVWTALGAGAVIALWRLLRRQSLQQVLGGFGGVAISAFVAGKTGNAADFFLPGLLINVAYGMAFVISNLVRWPLIGLGVGAATGDPTGWRKDPELYRAFRLATWVWAGMFLARLAVQLPLYFLGLVGALGVAKIVMGWPIMLLVGLWSYRLIKPALADSHARAKAAGADEPGDDAEPGPATAS